MTIQACRCSRALDTTSEREKVRHRGIGDESRSRAVYAKLESNSEPERARVCQRVEVRARVGVTESHKEPERDREGSSKGQKESVKA